MQDGSDYGVYAQRYTADGIKMEENSLLIPIQQIQTTPSIATLAGDNFVIVWAGYGQASALLFMGSMGSYILLKELKWSSFSIVTIASGHSIVDPVVAAADGGFVVAWSEFWYSSGCSYSYFILPTTTLFMGEIHDKCKLKWRHI